MRIWKIVQNQVLSNVRDYVQTVRSYLFFSHVYEQRSHYFHHFETLYDVVLVWSSKTEISND